MKKIKKAERLKKFLATAPVDINTEGSTEYLLEKFDYLFPETFAGKTKWTSKLWKSIKTYKVTKMDKIDCWDFLSSLSSEASCYPPNIYVAAINVLYKKDGKYEPFFPTQIVNEPNSKSIEYKRIILKESNMTEDAAKMVVDPDNTDFWKTVFNLQNDELLLFCGNIGNILLRASSSTSQSVFQRLKERMSAGLGLLDSQRDCSYPFITECKISYIDKACRLLPSFNLTNSWCKLILMVFFDESTKEYLKLSYCLWSLLFSSHLKGLGIIKYFAQASEPFDSLKGLLNVMEHFDKVKNEMAKYIPMLYLLSDINRNPTKHSIFEKTFVYCRLFGNNFYPEFKLKSNVASSSMLIGFMIEKDILKEWPISFKNTDAEQEYVTIGKTLVKIHNFYKIRTPIDIPTELRPFYNHTNQMFALTTQQEKDLYQVFQNGLS